MTDYKYTIPIDKLKLVELDSLGRGVIDLLYLLRNAQPTDTTAADIATASKVLSDIYQQLSDYTRIN